MEVTDTQLADRYASLSTTELVDLFKLNTLTQQSQPILEKELASRGIDPNSIELEKNPHQYREDMPKDSRIRYPSLLGFEIGIASALALVLLFLGSRLWGGNVGYWVIATYWILVVGGGIILVAADEAEPYLRQLFGFRERQVDNEGPDEMPNEGLSSFWALAAALFFWPITVGTIRWLLGFQEPDGWFYILVICAFVWPLLLIVKQK
jgi:hypothetical protein